MAYESRTLSLQIESGDLEECVAVVEIHLLIGLGRSSRERRQSASGRRGREMENWRWSGRVEEAWEIDRGALSW